MGLARHVLFSVHAGYFKVGREALLAQDSSTKSYLPSKNSGYIGRLAPSPTGALHLGNMRSFLIAWAHCRQNQGKLQLRIEDLHTVRLKPGALEQIFDDLHWLGIHWDEGPQNISEITTQGAEFVQSLQCQRYIEVFEQLKTLGRVYPCACTRKEIEMVQSAPHGDHELKYPGTCRNKKLTAEEIFISTGRPAPWRFIVDDEFTDYVDGVHGPQKSKVLDWSGDFVIAQHQNALAYQLAVVVDDHHHGVTHVIRGDDLLASTHRQLQIYRALNWTPPHFHHLPLLIGKDGHRLAKRHGDWKVTHLRELGHGPEDIIGLIASTLGLCNKGHPMSLEHFLATFQLEKMSRQAFVLDAEEFLFCNNF